MRSAMPTVYSWLALILLEHLNVSQKGAVLHGRNVAAKKDLSVRYIKILQFFLTSSSMQALEMKL